MKIKTIVLTMCLIVMAAYNAHAQTQTGYRIPARQDIGGGRMTGDMWCQYGTNGVRFRIGTQTVTQVGTVGVLNGTNVTGQPSLDFTYGGGSISANFNGFNAVYVAGSQLGTSGALSGKLDAVGGVGTNNTFNNPTLAGIGTITANFGANGLVITPAEYASVNNATSELQAQITTVTGSISGHGHGGTDTIKITYSNILGIGTNTPTQIDTFINSKAAASGLASLDANSLVVQNPANGTSTPTASKIVMTDAGTTTIKDAWIPPNFTRLGTPTTDVISEGSNNKYYTDAKVNSAVGSLAASALSDIDYPTTKGNAQVMTFNSSSGNWENKTSTASIAWGGVTGTITDQSGFLQEGTTTAQRIPLTKSTGAFDDSWLYEAITLQGTTTDKGNSTHGTIWQDISQTGTTSSNFSTDSNIELLLHLNHGSNTTVITDYSTNLFKGTATGSAKVSNTLVFGDNNSCYFPGGSNDDKIVFLDNDVFTLGTQSFTMQTRFRTITSDTGSFYSQTNAGATQIAWQKGSGVVEGMVVYANNAPLFGTTSVFVFANNTTYVVELTRNGNDFVLMAGTATGQINVISSVTSTINIADRSEDVNIGGQADGAPGTALLGFIDEFYYSRGSVLHTGTWTDTVTTEFSSEIFQKPTLKIEDPQGISRLSIQTGSDTTEPSYILLNATTTVFGLGTTTAITGTTTLYSGWFDGAVRATAFNVASTEEIKENIADIKIKPDLLDAEAEAKTKYIADNKASWVISNQSKYTTVINETGTGTVTKLDTVTMEAGYTNYIELAWASDLNQGTYTENIQKKYENKFWQQFHSMKPKSWNPKENPGRIRRGFVVEEAPTVILGEDEKSIDPMAVIAYQQKALQAMKVWLDKIDAKINP